MPRNLNVGIPDANPGVTDIYEYLLYARLALSINIAIGHIKIKLIKIINLVPQSH